MKNKYVSIIGLCGQSIFMKTDHFHKNGETIVVDEKFIEPGGKGYNQAVTIKKMGVDCAFLGSIGNDDFGKCCNDYLVALEIDTHLIIKPAPTAFATILFDRFGQNQVSVYPGASAMLTINDLDNYEEVIKNSAFLSLQLENNETITKKAVEMAKKHNVPIILNPAPAKAWVKDIINDCYIITPNLQEAKVIFNIPDDVLITDLGFYLINKKIPKTIITLGSEGALVIENDAFYYIEAYKSEKPVVDTTGAGDIFNGALIAALVKGESLDEAVKFGIKVSGISVTNKYVLASIPEINEI